MSEQILCRLNGRPMPAVAAGIPVLDCGLWYGDGAFEGSRFYHRRACRLATHLRRLSGWARFQALITTETREAS